jgi:hypothetical protein
MEVKDHLPLSELNRLEPVGSAALGGRASSFDVTMSQFGSDAAATEFSAMGPRVVTAIALHASRPPPRSPRLAADRRDRFDQRQQLRHVVSVCPRERRDRGNALTSVTRWCLLPALRRSVSRRRRWRPKMPATLGATG